MAIGRIPCMDWSCKLPHEILRTGPAFASFHPLEQIERFHLLEQIEPIHEDQRAELDSAEAPS